MFFPVFKRFGRVLKCFGKDIVRKTGRDIAGRHVIIESDCMVLTCELDDIVKVFFKTERQKPRIEIVMLIGPPETFRESLLLP